MSAANLVLSAVYFPNYSEVHLQVPCRGIEEAPSLESLSVINLRSIISL